MPPDAFSPFPAAGAPRRRSRGGGVPAGFDLLDTNTQQQAVDFGVVGGEAAARVDERRQRAQADVLTHDLQQPRGDIFDVKGPNKGRVKAEYQDLLNAGTPDERTRALGEVKGLQDAAAAKDEAAALKELRSKRTQLGAVKRFHDQALKAFNKGEGSAIDFQPDGNGGEADVGTLAGQIAALRKQAEDRVGIIKGALTPGVSAGDPTDQAKAAQAQLPNVEKQYQLLMEKRQRIKAEHDRVSKLYDSVNRDYSNAVGRRYGLGALDAELGNDSVATNGGPVTADPTMPDGRVVKPIDLLRMHSRIKEIDATINGAGDNLDEKVVAPLKQQRADLATKFNADYMKLSPAFQKRIDAMTKDATTMQKVGGAVANVAQGAGDALTDTGEFWARNAHLVPNLLLPGLSKVTDAMKPDSLKQAEAGAQGKVREFTDAMRDEAASWSKWIPDNAREQVSDSFWTGSVARGAGSSLAFMAPGAVIGGIGRIAGLGEASIGKLITASVATTGAASEGNSFRREAENALKPKLEAGDITQDEFNRSVGMAELFGAAVGTTEVLPVSRFARRVAEVPAGRTFIRAMLDTAGREGIAGVKKWIRGPGKRILVDVLSEGFEEGGQEWAQNMAEDIYAQKTFDPKREVGASAAEAGAAGGVSGMLFSTLTSLLGAKGLSKRYKGLGEAVLRGAEARRAGAQQVDTTSRGGGEATTGTHGVNEPARQGPSPATFSDEGDNTAPLAEPQADAELSAELGRANPAKPDGATIIDRGHAAKFTDEQGQTDQTKFAADVTSQVEAGLKEGKPVTFVTDGGAKSVPITSVENGMMQDATGARWGTLGILTQKGEHVEIGAAPQQAGQSAGATQSTSAAPTGSLPTGPNTGTEIQSPSAQQETTKTWEMSPAQYAAHEETLAPHNRDFVPAIKSKFGVSHQGQEAAVHDAIARGEKVPAEVLKRFPQLTQRAPEIPGFNTPAKFTTVLSKAAGLKPTDRASKFLAQFSQRLVKASESTGNRFAAMRVHVLSQSEWDSHPQVGTQTPDSAGAFDPETNTLFINSARNKGEAIVNTVVHEAGHFAEKFYLGEEFVKKEWASLTDEQRRLAFVEYHKMPDISAISGAHLKFDARVRSEWVAMQFSRVVRGETAGMSEQFKAKLEEFLNLVRDLVNKWVGDGKLTTPALDAKIVEMLGYGHGVTEKAGKKAQAAQKPTKTEPNVNKTPAAENIAPDANKALDAAFDGLLGTPVDRRGIMPTDEQPDELEAAKATAATLREAVSIASGGSAAISAGKPGQVPSLAEQEAGLSKWASAHGLVLDAAEFSKEWRRQGQLGGAENQIYFDEPSQRYVKRNALGFNSDWISFFRRILAHNRLFPDTAYRFHGFTAVDETQPLARGEIQAVLSQPFVEGRRSTDEELAAALKARGFVDGGTVSGQFENDRFIIDDVSNESPNVLTDTTGAVRFIDPLIYPKPGVVLGAPAEAEEQAGIPPERIGQFVSAAQTLIKSGVLTPEAMAKVLEEKFAGKARKYSQALWNAFGMVNPTLSSKPDWTAVYSAADKATSRTDQRPPSNARTELAPAEASQGSSNEQSAKPAKKGKRISVGTGVSGIPDILNDIEARGGIQSSYTARKTGGEYDDFAASFTGPARLLLRREGGQTPDQVAKELHDDGLLPDGSVTGLTDAIAKAVRAREVAKKAQGREEYAAKFDRAFLGNEHPREFLRAGKAITVDDLNAGDEFTVEGEKFRVKSVDENGNVTIQDGITKTVPAGTPVYPDKGKVKHAKTSTEFAPPVEPGATQDLFGADTPFNLAGESQQDGARLLSERLNSEEAKRAQDKAQTQIPGTEKTNEPRTNSNLERNRPGSDASDAGGKTGVQADGSSTGAPRGSVGPESSEQIEPSSTTGDSAVGGEGRDQPLPERAAGAIEPTPSPRGSEQPGGSVGVGEQGILAESGADTAVDSNAADRPGGDAVASSRDRSLGERVRSQRAAESVGVVDGDLANIAATLPVLLPEQHGDVLKAERRLLQEKPVDGDPKRGVLFTNGTGTGKTFTGLGIIKRAMKRGKKNVLILVPSFKKAVDWKRDGTLVNAPIDILESTSDAGKNAVVTTYANFRMNEKLRGRDFDLVVYDESHKLMENEEGSATSGYDAHRFVTNHPDVVENKAVERFAGPRPVYPGGMASSNELAAFHEATAKWENKRDGLRAEIDKERQRLSNLTKVVFLSATPFAYHKTLRYADGYLFETSQKEGGTHYNEASGFDAFLVSNFGYRMRFNKVTQPESGVDVDLMERAFTDSLMKSGAVSGRAIDVPFDYSREFVLVDPGLGVQLDRGLAVLHGWEDRDKNNWHYLAAVARARFKYHYVQQLMEAIKAAQAVARIREHIALGRKVIVFHSYVNSLPSHPFRGLMEYARSPEAKREIQEFEARYPDLLNVDFGRLANPLKLLEAEFGDAVRFYNGNVSDKKRAQAVDAFNEDDSPVKVIVGQLQSFKEGVSAHDTSGKHSRVTMHLELPIRPTDAIQSEGRAYRIGQASNAAHEYVTIHTNAEKYAFGSKINERVRTAENLAMGSEARALQTAFKQGYLNPVSEAPSENQGKGGKASDRRAAVATPFDQAKTFYFARQKKTARTKSAEGTDYFATPEPLGLKMVEWLHAKPDEHLLEPSAGHGAIARFFPNFTTNHFIEPSVDLANELRIKVDKGAAHVQQFEDFYVGNKFDGIAMNPPFGLGGSTAIPHLVKATEHLNDGGRIVAIIPEGPTADKKFDKWYEEAGKQFIKIADIGLPNITFERAGTSAKTRLVVIDRIDDQDARSEARTLPRRDISADAIGELFDKIQDIEIPPRTAPKAKPLAGRNAVLPAGAGTAVGDFASESFAHTRSGETIHVAKPTKFLGDAFSKAKSAAAAHGGYYSKFKQGGAIPGFHFKTAQARDAFLDTMRGGVLGTPGEPLRQVNKNEQVPGQPGYRYRSHPDSLINAGIETAREIYKTRGNMADDATAKAIIKHVGESAAAEMSMSPDADLPGAIKSAIAVNLQVALNKRRFDPKLSAEDRRKWQRMSDRLAQVKAEEFTDMGQAIQFLARLNEYSPDGVLTAAKRAVEGKQEKIIGEDGKKAVDEAAEAVQAENEKAIDAATADMERALRAVKVGKSIWQRYREMAARKWLRRIDSALNGAPEMPPLMEFTNRLIREVQNKIDAALPPGETAPRRTPAEIIREAVNNREKYKEAWELAREEIAEKYGERPDVLEKLDEAMLGLLDKPFSDATLDRAIKDAHRDMGISVRDLARMHYKQADALGQSLADKLIEQTGLKKEDADRLESLVKQRVSKLTADAKKKALLRLAAKKTGRARRVLSASDKIIELSNLGALTNKDYFKAVAEHLKLPGLSEQQAEKLRDLAEKAEATPDGFQRDRVLTDLLSEMQKIRGVGPVDIATAVYYAHILSGYTTQAVNAVSTALNTAADIAVKVGRHPSTAFEAARGIRDGAKTGFVQALSILDNGYAHRSFDEKLPEVSPVLEMLAKDKDRNVALRGYSTLLRYISRAMKATDAVFFHAASEAYQRVAAANLAGDSEEGGLDWSKRASKVRDMLAMSPAEFEQARQQAKAEGLRGLDFKLRVAEIIRQKRDPALAQAGVDFGREATFNQEPRGYLGIAAKAIREASQKFPPLKLFVPFTNIVSNVANASLNYSPVGVVRAFRGYGGELAPTAEERDSLLIKGIAGSLGLIYLLAYGMGDDDKEPWITANGPKDANARNQLRKTGWKPYTVKIGGAYVSYLETPLAIPLAIVGNYIDGVKFNGLDKKETTQRLGTALASVPETIVSMSFLRGLADFMDAVRGRKNWGEIAANTAASLVVPNLVRQIDRTFDPTVHDTSGTLGSLVGQVPGIRESFPAKLDVIGKPVTSSPTERFGRSETDDELWKVLADKQAWIPEAGHATKIGKEKMTAAQYREYVQLSGPGIEARLRAALPALRQMTPEKADEFVQKVTRQERAKAKPRVKRVFHNPFNAE